MDTQFIFSFMCRSGRRGDSFTSAGPEAAANARCMNLKMKWQQSKATTELRCSHRTTCLPEILTFEAFLLVQRDGSKAS